MDQLRIVQPPSPRMPGCPHGYLCCRDTKHYNPHNELRCCGDMAYYPNAQFCSDGAVQFVDNQLKRLTAFDQKRLHHFNPSALINPLASF